MNERQQRQQRRRLIVPTAQPALPARNTLDSTRLPAFNIEQTKVQYRPSTAIFCASSSTNSEKEGALTKEIVDTDPQLPTQLGAQSSEFNLTTPRSNRLSHLGDSSSLFSDSTKKSPISLLQEKCNESPPSGAPQSTTISPFASDLSPPSKMVVEREPPKATPRKPAQQPAFASSHQPEFGKPSPMQNRLQPNNVFNITKPYHPRPEHHRPTPATSVPHPQQRNDNAPRFVNPFRHPQPLQPRPDNPTPDVMEIPRPVNYPAWSSYPRPQPVYSSFNTSANGFTSVNAPQKPFIDLTTSKDRFNPDDAIFDDRFAAVDPYTYVDAGKATENIKALLEGAFEDDEDKMRIRGRKKKVQAEVGGLTGKLEGLDVKGVNQKDVKEDAEKEEDEDGDEEADDGTVEGLKVKLLPHQVDGVNWMRDKEVGVKKKNGILPKGGILADDVSDAICRTEQEAESV